MNPNRVFNLTAFVGGGANIAWGNDEANDIAKNLTNLNAYNLRLVKGLNTQYYLFKMDTPIGDSGYDSWAYQLRLRYPQKN